MHTLFSILFGGILLILIARALIETAIGLCRILIGLALYAFVGVLSVICFILQQVSNHIERTSG